MTSTDYLIDIALVSLVFIQVRPRAMNLRSLLLPLVAVAGAGAYYLKSVPTGGHDVLLDLTLAVVGAGLGIACALTTRVWRGGDGVARSQAGAVAAALWIVGIGSRFAFSEYVSHGGSPTISRFSIAHMITGADAWTAALVIMALAEVVARLTVLRLRARTATVTGAPTAGGTIPSRRKVAA